MSMLCAQVRTSSTTYRRERLQEVDQEVVVVRSYGTSTVQVPYRSFAVKMLMLLLDVVAVSRDVYIFRQ